MGRNTFGGEKSAPDGTFSFFFLSAAASIEIDLVLKFADSLEQILAKVLFAILRLFRP